MDQLASRAEISSLAGRQHGAISLQQLLDAGVGPGLVKTRCRAGEWTRACKTVVIVAGSPETVQRRLWIAYLTRDACFISGRSAAAVHQFDGSSYPRLPEITIPYTGDGRSSVARVTRSEFFSSVSLNNFDGLPVSSEAETIFTIAAWVSPRRVARLVDDLLIRSPGAIDELQKIYARYQGHRMRGMGTMRPIVLERSELSFAPTESELESLAWALFADAGIPDLRRQSPLPWAPGAGRVDLFVPSWQLIIELDGRRWHTRTEDFERDRSRDNAAIASGYSVMRFTWEALTSQPDKCLRLVNEFGSRLSRPPPTTSVHQPAP